MRQRMRLTATASSLGIHTTVVQRIYVSMTSANGGTYAGQYPCDDDGCVDNLESTTLLVTFLGYGIVVAHSFYHKVEISRPLRVEDNASEKKN